MNNVKKIRNLVIISCALSFFVFAARAVEPSCVMRLPPEADFYVKRDWGVAHNVVMIKIGDKKSFFKECKPKLSMYDTAKRTINEYFKDKYKKDQSSMLISLLNKENLKKFINMEIRGSGQASKWLRAKNKSDTSVLGLTEPLSDNFKNRALPNFLPYAFAEFTQYRANKDRKIGELQDTQQVAALATMRIAKLLGLSGLVVNTEFVEIKMPDSSSKFGIIMDCAKGVAFKQLKKLKYKNIKPSFQRSISNLMVMDALCAQRDRWVGNYFSVVSGAGDIIDLSAYDNELAFDSYADLKRKHFCLPATVDANGELTLPHMDKDLADVILRLKEEDVSNALKVLLTENQISSTLVRLRQLKNAIKKSINEKPHFLLSPSEWSEETISEELSIKANTYLKYYKRRLERG